MDFNAKRGQACTVYVSEKETEAVRIAAGNLLKDLGRVLGAAGVQETADKAQILIGTIGNSAYIDELVATGKLKLTGMQKQGKLHKEAYLLCVRDGKLIIAGSDRRGTVYGIYEFCEMLGVSPWYFWADVPVKEKQKIYLEDGWCKADYPSVEYRGIFINDEEELEAWVKNYMGEETIGVKTYEKVFELLLRLKGNYIWPAMHVNSFNLVPANGALADRMGIVVGTSHCDMLMRSNNREWKPWLAKKGYTDVKYDYSVPGRNREILKEYWQESVEQNKNFEVCYTIGMRGIHDSGFETRGLAGMSEEEKKKAKVELLTTIIKDQREILKNTIGHDTMMTFIPYKEVLPLYDSGMDIPEDMTLVWTNDNYGYVRRYPSEKEKLRKGGNGLYYHNSYWAPPSMSYVFLCSIPLAHTGNELRKAYAEGIQKLWVMNVGAMKPLEQEIEFFLRLAWEIGKENESTADVDRYVENWIDRNFEGGIGRETAKLLNDFSQLTNTRKLENMDYDAFSQTAYGDEAVVRIHKYEEMFQRGNAIYEKLKPEEKDAYFQMVLLRIHAAYFTNLQYYYGDRSTLMFNQGKMQAAGFYTEKAIEFDDARRKLINYYNHSISGGKWNGIVNPESFPPPRAAMLPVCTPPISMGMPKLIVNVWNEEKELTFGKPGTKWFEIGNGGEGEIPFEIQAPEWLALSEKEGIVQTEKRILVTVDNISGEKKGTIIIKNLTNGVQESLPVCCVQRHVTGQNEITAAICDDTNTLSYPEDGVLVAEADTAQMGAKAPFHRIKRLGRGCGNLMEAFVSCERTEGQQVSSEEALNYSFYLDKKGEFLLEVHRFPSLNSVGRIRIGVSVDEQPLMILETEASDEWRGNWKSNVLNNVDRLYLKLPELEAGEHTLHFYAIDKYFAFSRFALYTEERRENNFVGINGDQNLPLLWNQEEWAERFYGKIVLKPRPVEYARIELETDNITKDDLIRCAEKYADKVKPEWYLQEGSCIFAEQLIEREEAICIDAAAALAQSDYAYTSNGEWQHCNSESYGRSGLAMYIRKRGIRFQTMEEAPTLNYRIKCQGGEYTVWLLSKFSVREEAYFAVGLDGVPVPQEKLYWKGCLWRYEAEQIYRWVPLTKLEMTEGEHLLQLAGLASGLRFDRVYVTKGTELPPMDLDWRK